MSSNFSQNDQLKVRGCAFQGNEAKKMGGAIGINRTRMNGYVVEISDCEFSNNKAGSAGGAIYVQLSSGDHQKKLATFDFNNCHFNNNRAGGMGGAFCQITEPLTGAATTLSHCSFSKNQVSASEGNLRTDWLQNRERIAAAGGAVAAVFQNEPDSLTTFRLYDCQFEENASAGVGGACYVESAQPDRVPVQFFDAVFNKNTAPEGSAIYHNALSKPLKLTGSNLPEGGVGQVAGATQRVFWEKALPKTPAEKPKGKWITDEKGNRIFTTFGN